MSIIRAPRPEQNFTVLGNHVLRDHRLSFRARGVLAYLLSMPDNWRTSSDSLSRMGLEGRDAVRTALGELEIHGYVRRNKQQNKAGQWVTETYVFDSPELGRKMGTTGDVTHTPTPENPTSDNQALIEELTTKDLSNNSHTYLGSSLKVCGHCDGTGWRVSAGNDVVRCTCRGGLK